MVTRNSIKSEEISVVVQGPIHKIRTTKCLKSIRKNLPDAEIILSTWENSDINGLDFDVLVLCKEPVAILQKKFKSKPIYNNMNRMILSTQEGLKKVSRKYTLKLRSDSYLNNIKFINEFDKFPIRANKYCLFENRILASTLFSKQDIKKSKNEIVSVPFHVSDWWFFGLTSDIKTLLMASRLVEEPNFSNYFEYPENQQKKSVYKNFDWKFAPEQYLAYSCFSKYYDDIKMVDCSDVTESIKEKSNLCLANNFIFLEYKQSGISNLKYLYSKCEAASGEQYLWLYSYYKFELEYQKYCNPDYIPTAKNLILSDKEKGYRILRFYKHIFKLIDTESSFMAKLEQLFLGIPISGITLIPTLIEVLKEKK